MCGRYRLSRRKQIIEEHFDSVSGDEDWSPRYNIAPTQPIPVIRQNPKEPVRELSLMSARRKHVQDRRNSDCDLTAIHISASIETCQ
jgi:putative SOS response-associated peptidase YedK